MQVAVNDININFQVYGSGVPIVVLHGWGDRSDTWYQFAQLLSDRFQIFLVDLPGFGGSDSPDTVWGVENYCQAIKTLINELEIERPILLGHSHGGKIACHLAQEENFCRALILVSSSGVDIPSLTVKLKIIWFKTLKFILRPFGKTGETILDQFRKQLGSRDYQDAGPLRATMVKVVNHKLFNLLPNIKVPTLIVWGSDDQTLSIEQAKTYAKLIPDSYIRIVWGGSHHPHIGNPAELAEIVGDFLAQV